MLGNADRNDLIRRCVDLLGVLRYLFRYALVKQFFFTLRLVFCVLVWRSKKPTRGSGMRQLELSQRGYKGPALWVLKDLRGNEVPKLWADLKQEHGRTGMCPKTIRQWCLVRNGGMNHSKVSTESMQVQWVLLNQGISGLLMVTTASELQFCHLGDLTESLSNQMR